MITRRSSQIEKVISETKVAVGQNVYAREAGRLEQIYVSLTNYSSERFPVADILYHLQDISLPEIQFVKLDLLRPVTAITPMPLPGQTKTVTTYVEHFELTIQAKDYGEPPANDPFVEQFGQVDFFKELLRSDTPVSLKDLQARKIDPFDINQSFILFTIECQFRERTFRAK